MCSFNRWALAVLAALASTARAMPPETVYLPYVTQLERELEYRLLRTESPDVFYQKLAYGQSVNDKVFVEGSVVWSDIDGQTVLQQWELELQLQLTEQGEYSFDWGLLLELERLPDADAWEYSAQLLVSRQWQRWQMTVNAGLEIEQANETEIEPIASTQLQYRYSKSIAPALELYYYEDYFMAGPELSGNVRLNGRRAMQWGAGFFVGIDSLSPDWSVKFNLEFEF